MKTYRVQAAFQTWWHIGTGRGAGHFLDAMVERDEAHLPVVSGKTLKGLFRDAAQRLVAWGRMHEAQLTALFGKEGAGGNAALRFSDLRLSDKERAALLAQPELIGGLYSQLTSTAIDEKTGYAKNKTLRTVEVVVPLILQGRIELDDESQASSAEVADLLNQMSALITHIGSRKSRGFGEVLLTIREESES